MDNDLMFSSGNDEYETPKYLFDILHEVFNFTLDPCASELSHQVDNFFTVDDDGLTKSWDWNRSFVNFPYSKGRKWLEKCHEQSRTGEVVVLCPARTDTIGFQDHVFPVARAITFLRGRLKFINRQSAQYVTLRLIMEGWKGFGVYEDIDEVYSKITYGGKWKGNKPKKEVFDNAHNIVTNTGDIHKVLGDLVLSYISGAPFPSCLIYYTDRASKIEKVEKELNGHTVFLK